MNVRNMGKIVSTFLCIMLIISGEGVNAYAYQYNNYKLSNPSNVKYKVSSSIGQYTSIIMNYTEKWEIYCDEITLSNTGSDENIYFYGDINVDNGTYAVTYHNRNDYHIITFYKAFDNTTSNHKNETIVHEVGHALGLAHCEKGKESVSVMRASDFNNRAYPLSDDINGIANLY